MPEQNTADNPGYVNPYVWVVYDLSQPAPYGGDEPKFGPMTEAEAIQMVQRRPDAYWRKRL